MDTKIEIFTTTTKISYTPLMELTTHLVKMKLFDNEIKILYPLWGVQPYLEK